MNLRPSFLIVALLASGIIGTAAWQNAAGQTSPKPAKQNSKPTVFEYGELRVTDFYPVRYQQADDKNPYLRLILAGQPRINASIPSKHATMVGGYASFEIDETEGLLHHGRVGKDPVLTISQPDKDGGDHVTVLTSTTLDYDNSGTKDNPAFKLQLKEPVVLTSAFAPKKEKIRIDGQAGHFEFTTPAGAKQVELNSGVLAGPVKFRFEGMSGKGDKAKKTIVNGSGDRMEITRDGTDYLIKLVGHVVFESVEPVLSFHADADQATVFRFSSDFGFKSFDGGQGVTNIPSDAFERSGDKGPTAGNPR